MDVGAVLERLFSASDGPDGRARRIAKGEEEIDQVESAREVKSRDSAEAYEASISGLSEKNPDVRLPPALEQVPHDSAEAYQRREAPMSDDSAEASMRAGGGVNHDSAESWRREKTSRRGEWMPRGLRRRRPGTLYKKEPAILFPFRSKLVPANGLKQIRVDSLRFIHPAATGERFTDAGRKEEAVQKLQKAEAM